MTTSITERVEGLKRRHRALQDREIRLEGEMSALEAKQAELTAEMKAKYGVDNVDALRKLVSGMQEEDATKVEAWDSSLSQTEDQFSALESK